MGSSWVTEKPFSLTLPLCLIPVLAKGNITVSFFVFLSVERWGSGHIGDENAKGCCGIEFSRYVDIELIQRFWSLISIYILILVYKNIEFQRS